MAGHYHLDLEEYSLEKFRRLIESQELSPGRRILKDKLSERFAVLESTGIVNLGMLVERLKNADRLKLTKGSFTVKDIAYCIDTANEHTEVIEY